MYALVLDGELKSALAAVRALGRAQRTVSVGSLRSTGLAGFSRFAHDRFVYPDPKLDQDRFTAHVVKAAKAFPEPPVLFTFSDATYLAVFAHRAELAQCVRLVLPRPESVAIAFDKAATYDLAQRLSIPTIPELNLAVVTEFPVVVKPRTSVSWASGVGRFGTADIVLDAESFGRACENVRAQTGADPIVQKYIVGTEYGVECLADDGIIGKVFVHRRIRSQDPRGGAATVKAAVLSDPRMVAMVAHTKALIAALAWSGPIMVEWKVDAATDTPLLMEINGRFWGSLPLPERAGISFTLGYDVLARGYRAPKARPIKPLTTQHFLGDVRWLYRVLFARDALRASVYPPRLLALYTFLRTSLMTPGDVFSLADPVPFFMEYIDSLKKML